MSPDQRLTAVERVLILPCSVLGGIALLLLAVVVTGEVVLRAMGVAIIGANETGGVLLALLIFLAIGYTQSLGGHVSIEVVVNLTPRPLRRIADAVSNLICGGLSLVLAWSTAEEAVSSYDKMEYQFGTMEFPLWPVKAVIAFGMLLLALAFVASLPRQWRSPAGAKS